MCAVGIADLRFCQRFQCQIAIAGLRVCLRQLTMAGPKFRIEDGRLVSERDRRRIVAGVECHLSGNCKMRRMERLEFSRPAYCCQGTFVPPGA